MCHSRGEDSVGGSEHRITLKGRSPHPAFPNLFVADYYDLHEVNIQHFAMKTKIIIAYRCVRNITLTKDDSNTILF